VRLQGPSVKAAGTEIGFRWLRPDASTFAELCTQGVRGVTLDGVSLPPPEDGRLGRVLRL
jgi:hypothetical protein